MKNFSEHPKFDLGKKSDDESKSEREVIEISPSGEAGGEAFEEAGGDIPIKTGEVSDAFSDARRIDLVRESLAEDVLKKSPKGFMPVYDSADNFALKRFKPAGRSVGRFRRWFTVALAGLGMFGTSKLQAENNADSAPVKAGKSAAVPIFKAPANPSSTNVYRYEQSFNPSPEALKANAERVKTVSGERVAPGRQAGSSNEERFGQTKDDTFGSHDTLPRPNQSQFANSGNQPQPNYKESANNNLNSERRGSQLMNEGNYQVFNQPGAYYGGQNGVYYDAPAHVETRKLFGQKFKGVVQDQPFYYPGGFRAESGHGKAPRKNSPPRK